MSTAFVLSGGGNLGAVQVGMLRALSEAGVTPDLLIGTSAGALNAAFVAALGMDAHALDILQRQWVTTRRGDVFPLEPVRLLAVMTGRAQSLFSNHGLRRIVERNLSGVRLEQTATPLKVIATDLLSGLEVVIESGDAVTAILASTAIPGVYPPVVPEGGQALVDGGLADNTAVTVAVEQGVDRVVVLPAGYPCALPEAPKSTLAISLQALEILIQQRLIADMVRMQDSAHIATMPPLCPLRVSPVDFSRAEELIERAYRDSARWIAEGGLERKKPERYLSLHKHS